MNEDKNLLKMAYKSVEVYGVAYIYNGELLNPDCMKIYRDVEHIQQREEILKRLQEGGY